MGSLACAASYVVLYVYIHIYLFFFLFVNLIKDDSDTIVPLKFSLIQTK